MSMNDLLRSSGLTMMPNDKDMAQVDKAIEWVTKNPKSEQERRLVNCRRRFWQGKRMVAAMAKIGVATRSQRLPSGKQSFPQSYKQHSRWTAPNEKGKLLVVFSIICLTSI